MAAGPGAPVRAARLQPAERVGALAGPRGLPWEESRPPTVAGLPGPGAEAHALRAVLHAGPCGGSRILAGGPGDREGRRLRLARSARAVLANAPPGTDADCRGRRILPGGPGFYNDGFCGKGKAGPAADGQGLSWNFEPSATLAPFPFLGGVRGPLPPALLFLLL